MNIKKFNSKTIKNIGSYVYRLVDPRNGETFYVGKGRGNRVFDHVNETLNFNGDEDEATLKIRQIREIKRAGLEVIHIIHRWGLSEAEAYEVEAALIDVYQGLTNMQSGHGSDRGVVNANTLNHLFNRPIYKEPDFEYMIIKIREDNLHNNNEDVYETVRKCWKVNIDNANRCKYVFAVVNGIVENIYEVTCWKKSTIEGRYEFIGEEAPNNIKENIVFKRIPEYYRQKGNSNPIQYSKSL